MIATTQFPINHDKLNFLAGKGSKSDQRGEMGETPFGSVSSWPQGPPSRRPSAISGISRRPSLMARSPFASSTAHSHRSDGDSDLVSLHASTTGSEQTFASKEKGQPMFFKEMNPYAPETVVLLHVLFSSHLEWKDVWPKLPGHHLLIPDFPCHSKSKHVCERDEFSIELAAEHVVDMISSRAHDGRAHIVGLSAVGGWVALELCRKYPELVKSAFISGAYPLTGMRAHINKSPRLVYTGLWALLRSPAGKKKFFQASGLSGDGYDDELFEEIRGNVSARLAKRGMGPKSYEWLAEVAEVAGRAGIRVAFMAGSEHDSIPLVRVAGQVMNAQEGGQASVFVVKGANHAWNLQLPALFARSIQCWVEQWQMPGELESVAL